jgi:myo-inositol 2-dehydrogenase/D-chiro-inositol 1-dehydrogenase
VTTPLAVALLGYGWVAERVHTRVLMGLRGVRITAVADTDPERRKVAAAKTGAPTFASWEEALDPERVDAVVISLPPNFHPPAAELALSRGLHVYVEKPIAADLCAAAGLVGAWRRSGLVGMVGFNYRFNPLVRALRRQVSTGRVGRVIAVRSTFSVGASRAPGRTGGWRDLPGEGGGALLDLGVHHLDLIPFVLGDPFEAVLGASDPGGREESVTAQLRTTGGVTVQCLFSMASVDEDRIDVFGSGGKLGVARYDSTGPEAGRARGPRGAARAAVEWAGALLHPYRFRRHFSPGHEPSYRPALEAFVAGVRDGRSGSPDLVDGLRALAVVEAVRRSARDGKTVVVAGIAGPLPGAANEADP